MVPTAFTLKADVSKLRNIRADFHRLSGNRQSSTVRSAKFLARQRVIHAAEDLHDIPAGQIIIVVEGEGQTLALR